MVTWYEDMMIIWCYDIRRAFGPRACWITSLLFLVDTPLPPSRQLGPGHPLLGLPPTPSRALGTTFFQFWTLPGAFQDIMFFCHRFCFEKTAKILVFGLQKPLQNPSQNDLKSMCKKHIDFWRFCFRFLLFVIKADPWFYRHGQCFIAFLRFSSFTVWTRFGFKKSPQKPPKTTSKPLKNRVWKRLVFKHRFFAFLAPFWHVLGGSWASLGRLWASKMASKRVTDIDPRQFLFQLMSFS